LKASWKVAERVLGQPLRGHGKPRYKKDSKTFASQTSFEDLALSFVKEEQRWVEINLHMECRLLVVH